MFRKIQSTKIVSLAAQWQLLTMMMVAVARKIIFLERAGAQEALRKAEALEPFVRTAIVVVNEAIAEADCGAANFSEHDAHACAHMRGIAVALMALALWLSNIKDRLEARGGEAASWSAFSMSIHPAMPAYLTGRKTRRAGLLADYLDSG